MSHIYCTYFDQNYLLKGLVLLESLQIHDPGSILWVLALDDETSTILGRLNLLGVRLLTLAEMEDWEPDLLRAKTDRNRVEYFWTLTPSLIALVLENSAKNEVVSYLDADMAFYSSPQPLFTEMGTDSVLIHEHRYAPAYRYKTTSSGIFNVGLTGFRNDRAGWRVLNWWKQACLQACYYRPEEGFCGDQKYLDEWPQKFPAVHVLAHVGGGAAPWNIENYTLKNPGNITLDGQPLIFFHYHSFGMIHPRIYYQGGYDVSSRALLWLYRPYARSLLGVLHRVRKVQPDFRSGYHFPGGKEMAQALYRCRIILV